MVQIRPLSHGIRHLRIGHEATPLLIIDDLVSDPDWLVQAAVQGKAFQSDAANFYPGVRQPAPQLYQQALQSALLALLQAVFNPQADHLQSLQAAFSLSATPASQLRPIQMLPHIDATTPQQLAMVHYLCGPEHGGTSFYRHRETGFERISAERLASYSATLKAEAQAAHIWSVADGGPDIVPNGVALSATAHWLFDRHLISFDDNLCLLVSHNKVPSEFLTLFPPSGQQIRLPADPRDHPRPDFVAKHRARFAGF